MTARTAEVYARDHMGRDTIPVFRLAGLTTIAGGAACA